MSFGVKNVTIKDFILKNVNKVKSISSTTNSVSQDYEEIDYSLSDSSQDYPYIKDGILNYIYMGELYTKDISLLDNTISNDANTRDLLRRLQNNNDSTRSSLKSYSIYYELYLNGEVLLSDDCVSRLKKFYDLYEEYKVEEVYEAQDNDIKRISLNELTDMKTALEVALQNTNSDSEKEIIQYYIKQYQKSIELYEYDSLIYDDNYKKFVSNYKYTNLGYDLDAFIKNNWDPMLYYNECVNGIKTQDAYLDWYNHYDIMAIAEMLMDDAQVKSPIDVLKQFPRADFEGNLELYPFMTEEQVNIYHYLCATEGNESANKYLDIIREDVNLVAATYYADKFLQSLDLNSNEKIDTSIKNYFGVSGKGLLDGINGFFEGLDYVTSSDSTISIKDYEKMIIVQYLQENSNYYDDIYQFNNSFGNMLPAMITSAAITLVSTPVGGTSILVPNLTSSVFMGISAGGNAKHQGLIQGNGLLSSSLYGMFVGVSETTLGYFLGKIPGISKAAGLTFGNLLSEGVEEYLQEWVDAGLQSVILGEDIDWSQVPANAKKSFIMGALMSGFTNGGQAVINLTINGTSKKINVEEALKYIENHPDASIEAMPVFSEFFNSSDNTKVNDVKLDLNDYYQGNKIAASPGIDMTAKLIPVNVLSQLLMDDIALEKFNDFENNIDFFTVNSKQAYISALEKYYNNLKDNGCPISKDMQDRYNLIVAQSTKITNLEEYFSDTVFMFDHCGCISRAELNYLDSILFNDNKYNEFINLLDSYLVNDRYWHVVVFHRLYDYLKINNCNLEQNALNKLEKLNMIYLESINQNRNILSNYSEYGANQNCVKALALNPKANIELYKQIKDIVKEYYPNMSLIKINKLLRGMNASGICSYATVANEIFVQFEGREQAFKEYFGYDLYRIENGKKVFNAELLLTDLYCFANIDNPGVILKRFFGYSVKDDSDQIGMSGHGFKNINSIQRWLIYKASKGNNLFWKSERIFCANLKPNKCITDEDISFIRDKIAVSLAHKQTVSLDISSVQDSPYTYTMYSTDKSKYSDYEMNDNSNSDNKHASGHSMFVTGITESGDLVVSSWGREYILRFEEIKHRNITIFNEYLTDQRLYN